MESAALSPHICGVTRWVKLPTIHRQRQLNFQLDSEIPEKESPDSQKRLKTIQEIKKEHHTGVMLFGHL